MPFDFSIGANETNASRSLQVRAGLVLFTLQAIVVLTSSGCSPMSETTLASIASAPSKSTSPNHADTSSSPATPNPNESYRYEALNITNYSATHEQYHPLLLDTITGQVWELGETEDGTRSFAKSKISPPTGVVSGAPDRFRVTPGARGRFCFLVDRVSGRAWSPVVDDNGFFEFVEISIEGHIKARSPRESGR